MRGECDKKQATLMMSEHQSGSALENAQAACSRLEHLWGTNLSKQGVGPDFSLLTACYPYLARRLLTDDNPRAQEALRAEMLYDGSGASRIDLERLI